MYGPLIQHEGAFSMSIDRVPSVPFAQIANAALRDTRLSFKARGVLAMVLSHAGEWNANKAYIQSMSDHDGRESVQNALNELTKYGYRIMHKDRRADGTWASWIEWRHEPTMTATDVRETRLPDKPSAIQNTIKRKN